ncbi:hypothetical protein AB4571_01100 [Vibrio breoganii]|uniref:hypothetical protein n=1 Tax=Vibrio breoganii TaxID=553239 RepID=UPI0012E9EB7C|nr:hypothetical protein [Vibrio breoganii]
MAVEKIDFETKFEEAMYVVAWYAFNDEGKCPESDMSLDEANTFLFPGGRPEV